MLWKNIFLTARLAATQVADLDLAESVLSSTYWGREDDLDIEYSLIFQRNANLMLAHCLRRWFNINPNLAHVTSHVSCLMWWELSVILPVKFSATRHVSFKVRPRCRQWPCIKAALMPEVKLMSNRKNLSRKSPLQYKASVYDLESSEPCVRRCGRKTDWLTDGWRLCVREKMKE